MSNINLLPWRAQLKANQKKHFILQLSLVCLLGITLVILAYGYIKQQIQIQQQHNKAVAAASEQLNSTLHAIEQFRLQQQGLQRRAHFIEQLQQERALPVQLFNQLPSWIPINVHLERVDLSNKALIINGKAHTHGALALMVEHIEGSRWLLQPKLTVHATEGEAATPTHQFILQLEVKNHALR
ncbi:PilN domain-containing protein [Oceanisphaera pacifica]|uniref:PilN domain-containing protein n=1 Tax=Oceanisphaera pacifica TaxID=2818389 RepID=A0ABS3NCQ6_9GAMM|nr:PilN domain-containing protein [Oceanisphaera pacifica]MBO1518383.1 PilN domain-containing protein [Oceanisphaera pacifica]